MRAYALIVLIVSVLLVLCVGSIFALTATGSVTDSTVVASSASATISAGGVCQVVTNNFLDSIMVPHKYNEEWFDGSTSFISYWNSPPVNNIGKVILSSCVGGNCSDYSLHLTHLYENSSLFYILQLTERGFCNMSVSATYDTSIVVSNLTDLCNSLNSSCSGVLTCPVFNGSSIPVTPSRIIYSDALNYTFTVPVNVTSAIVQVIGAGGGGGSSRIVGTAQSGGGGGGGYGLKAVNVTAGATIPISVGLGGAGGFNSSNGLNGGLSSFNTSINATGGQGGRLNIFANCSKSAGVGGVANGTDANIKGHDGEAFCAFPNGDGGVNGYVVAYNTTVCSAYANPATCLAGYQDNNGGSSNGSGHAIGLDAILYEKNYSYTRAYFKIEELSNVYNVNGTLTSAYGLCSETFPYNCSDAGGYEYYNGVISSIGTYNFTEYYHNQVRLKALASDSFSLGNDPQWPSFSAPTSISGLSRGNTMGGAGYMGNGGGAGRGNGGGGRGGNGRVIIDLLETGESIACSTCASNNNKPCVSSANNCGLKNIGTFNCFGGCSASAPPDSATCCVPNTGASCTTTANACGITLSGKVLCDGTCEADPSTRLSVVCEGDGDIPPTTPPTCEELIDNNDCGSCTCVGGVVTCPMAFCSNDRKQGLNADGSAKLFVIWGYVETFLNSNVYVKNPASTCCPANGISITSHTVIDTAWPYAKAGAGSYDTTVPLISACPNWFGVVDNATVQPMHNGAFTTTWTMLFGQCVAEPVNQNFVNPSHSNPNRNPSGDDNIVCVSYQYNNGDPDSAWGEAYMDTASLANYVNGLITCDPFAQAVGPDLRTHVSGYTTTSYINPTVSVSPDGETVTWIPGHCP